MPATQHLSALHPASAGIRLLQSHGSFECQPGLPVSSKVLVIQRQTRSSEYVRTPCSHTASSSTFCSTCRTALAHASCATCLAKPGWASNSHLDTNAQVRFLEDCPCIASNSMSSKLASHFSLAYASKCLQALHIRLGCKCRLKQTVRGVKAWCCGC